MKLLRPVSKGPIDGDPLLGPIVTDEPARYRRVDWLLDSEVYRGRFMDSDVYAEFRSDGVAGVCTLVRDGKDHCTWFHCQDLKYVPANCNPDGHGIPHARWDEVRRHLAEELGRLVCGS